MLQLTIFEIFAVKILDFGTHSGTALGPISTIMQNLTPIGITVAEISVMPQKETQSYSRFNIRHNTYSSIVFVVKANMVDIIRIIMTGLPVCLCSNLVVILMTWHLA